VRAVALGLLRVTAMLSFLLGCAPEQEGVYRGVYIPRDHLLLVRDVGKRLEQSDLTAELDRQGKFLCVAVEAQRASEGAVLRLTKVISWKVLEGHEDDAGCRVDDEHLDGLMFVGPEEPSIALLDGRFFRNRPGAAFFSPRAAHALERARSSVGASGWRHFTCFRGRGLVFPSWFEGRPNLYLSRIENAEVVSIDRPVADEKCAKALQVYYDHSRPPPLPSVTPASPPSSDN